MDEITYSIGAIATFIAVAISSKTMIGGFPVARCRPRGVDMKPDILGQCHKTKGTQ